MSPAGCAIKSAQPRIGHVARKVGEYVLDLLRKLQRIAALQRHRHRARSAGRAPDAEIDAAGRQRFEHAERLRHFERAVVRQHDAAAAEPDARRLAGQPREQHFGRRIRNARQPVMFGAPVAVIPEFVRAPGERDRRLDRFARRCPAHDRRLVENAERNGHGPGNDAQRGSKGCIGGIWSSDGDVRAEGRNGRVDAAGERSGAIRR